MKKKQSKPKSAKKLPKVKKEIKEEVKKPKVSFFKKRKKKIIDYDDFIDENDDSSLEEDLDENVSYASSMFDSVSDHEEEKEEAEEEEEIIEDPVIEKIKNKKKPDKTKFYVEPKKFDEEIVKYYESGIMTNDLAEMVSKISNKLSYAPNFINYSYREEMVGDGIIRMMKALISKKYNREKGTNPFSYFTRIAFNAFRNRIKKEKHIHETHEKYRRELMSMSEGYSNLLKNNNIRIMKERDRLLE